MSPANTAARDRILAAAVAILDEGTDPDQITVRQIAERAEVGIGSINYHFQSKDNLLHETIGQIMQAEAGRWFDPTANQEADPLTRLRMLLKQTARIAARYPDLMPAMLRYAIEHGPMDVQLMVVPLLREILGEDRSETDLRWIAFQLVTPIQVIGLRMNDMRLYAGVDLLDDQQRDRVIDLMIDNLIPTNNNQEEQ